MNTTYNPKVVNRIDRVMLVSAIAISAFLIFAGANAGQDAQAQVAPTMGASSTVPTMQITIGDEGGSYNMSDGGGSMGGVSPKTPTSTGGHGVKPMPLPSGN